MLPLPPVMFQTSGDFTIDLPKGKWRIAVEHGNEYIPVTEEFAVADETSIDKTIELKRWIDLMASRPACAKGVEIPKRPEVTPEEAAQATQKILMK